MASQTPAQLILTVSTSLNDQEPGFTYTRWPIAELLGYLNESLSGVCIYRPDAFIFRDSIPIDATNGGSLQVLPAGNRLLKSIDSNGATSNCPYAPIYECDLNLARTFYKAPCLPTGGPSNYRVLAYGYDAKDPHAFYVFPPVPAGNSSTVNGVLIQEPPVYDLTNYTTLPINIDPNYYIPMKFWMQARAYEVDTESASSQTESDKYYKKFYEYFGVQYKQGSGYNKGQFLGQGGDNQMSKQRAL